VFGLRLTQQRDEVTLSTALLDDVVCGMLPATAAVDLLLGLAVLRYTQSNSVCYLRGGATLGIGAGQGSRVDCTRLAARRPTSGGCDVTRQSVHSPSSRTSGARIGSAGRSAPSRVTSPRMRAHACRQYCLRPHSG
jgi:AICAR transformylase/IMP cyclohydrolase PurH